MTPKRYSIEVQARIPEALAGLNQLAGNLLYSWDRRVRRVFRHMDPELWDACGHNPKVFLRWISQQRLDVLAQDKYFLEEYQYALAVFRSYREQTRKPHRDIGRQLDPDTDLIAYFCAEFGLHESLPVYSGGLGILAGDHCKAASDLGLPFVAVGLMYHQGYFIQTIDESGEQKAHFHPNRLEDLPIQPATGGGDEQVHVEVQLPGRTVRVRIWEAQVGHLKLYLLDTDVAGNRDQDRAITYQLYGGDRTNRLAQEIVLGIGGVRALRALGHTPTVWHINEGHAAFQILERTREHVSEGTHFDTALELVSTTTVFTTHTPVSAGHDLFDHGLIEHYLGYLAEEMNIPRATLLALGESPGNTGQFNMTALGLRGSRRHNGVSEIHGGVASKMEAYHWPQVPPEENPIGFVTNGVHVSTFLAREWAMMLDTRSHGWRDRLMDQKFWNQYIDSIPDQSFWNLRQNLKSETLAYVAQVLKNQYTRNRIGAAHTERLLEGLSGHGNLPLVIGFARRFATYKRATLLFRDPNRLSKLVNAADRPVVLLFAGKAHPADQPGQDLIRVITDYAEQPEFAGKLFFIENYDLALGRKLVAGVDVWLNNPQYPLEASGTSGQKAGINGVLNVSVLDGWWAETFNGENGWGITPHSDWEPEMRDRLESGDLLDILEREVIPLYFARNDAGYSEGWVHKSKSAMKSILTRHNAQRMLTDYLQDYYLPAIRHGKRLAADGAQRAHQLTSWKHRVKQAWPEVRIERLDTPETTIQAGGKLSIQVRARLGGLSADDVRMECVVGREDKAGQFLRQTCFKLEPTKKTDGETVFTLEEPIADNGLFSYEIRIFPYHPDLAHPFETGCMLWL
ncbi:MAG: alpha-glucan family phosphorylase [Pseudomonadota bacterium]|nr:alpha-glucan family phosphorylase [Pseudomonadota bacterium]